MQLCERVPAPSAPNCSAELMACDAAKASAANCYAAHAALIKCIDRHNEGVK